MKNIYKSLIVTLFLCCAQSAFAQSTVYDGNWLKSSLDTVDRLNTNPTSSLEDTVQLATVVSYIRGVIATQQKNNMLVSLYITTLTDKYGNFDKRMTSNEIQHLKVLYALAPLLAVPDGLQMKQVIAIIHKYVKNHPEKWTLGANYLIEDALKEAFPVVQSK